MTDDDVVEVRVREKIPLRCCVLVRRMQQPCRGPGCSHAAAFCYMALDSCAAGPPRRVRCPICEKEFDRDAVSLDVPLTMLLMKHPSASHAYAARSRDGEWRYKAAGGAPAAVDLDRGSGSRRRRGASDSGDESRQRRREGERQRRGEEGGREGGREAKREGRSDRGSTTGPAAPRRPMLPRSLAPRERPPAPGARLPVKLTPVQKAEGRAARKLAAQRARFLEAARAELIRRALHEEPQPGGSAEGWSVG